MTSHSLIRAALFAGFLCGGAQISVAQEPFPGEPVTAPKPQQAAPNSTQGPTAKPLPEQQLPPTIRVNTSVVLVPTLVEKPTGEVLYGLAAKDFTLEDNGVKQDIHVDDDLDAQPVSLVVCIQRGRSSGLEFGKLAKLGPLLDLFTAGGRGEAALVVFDSKPVYLDAFSRDTNNITEDLQQLRPGDGGAAIFDAVGYSVDLLEHRQPDHRRVLLLISESRDHGSKRFNAQDLVERIGTSNTLVLSLTFSPTKAGLMDWGSGNAAGGSSINVLAPLMMAIAAVHKNAAREIATMSGGEYASFTKEKGFQDRVDELASHSRNRYILSFHPSDLTPGLHTIQVKLNNDYNARVVARASYWAVSDATKTTGSAQ
ncbi:VWA domain-containing protein [Alloacidobacterium dinghuense]|uniref:VWA domain-containing protein n=1 Tax=Alloacidobacterium dinghuense TaxID=2763107 RepID=A0A7G8BPX5_9BACT|nr:VWA domain-containing protein [Alloacidobacterium dinghuense]QNI34595.1 VWA domain-containing protein [Alloacidobacterium dinghuense]